MPIYYYASTPETIVSIINTGKLPIELINQTNTDILLCARRVSDCFVGNYKQWQQVFILDIELSENSDFTAVDSVPIASIRKITVLNIDAQNHLQRLFNHKCPIPITIQPEIFPGMKTQKQKRVITDFFTTKKAETLIPAAAGSTPAKVPRLGNSILKKRSYQEILGRLSTVEEHIEILKLAFEEAKKTILITSFGINSDTFTKASLIRLITAARQRNVRIYIYYNDQNEVDKELLAFLKGNNVMCAETYTHSKILAVDKTLIVSGSFNWLSGCNASFKDNEEGSFYCRDADVCEGLIEEFWKYIKYYRNHQFDNFKRVEAFDRSGDKESSFTIEINDKTEIVYIPSLDQHCGFLQECLEKAKKRLIICSPFISGYRQYEEDLALDELNAATARGVDIYFIVGKKSKALSDFKKYLEQIKSTKIHVIEMNDIHLKTVIVDDTIISEGSFNWLSASRDDRSDYHNHEQTLVIEGDLAKPLIESFLSGRVGQALIARTITTDKLTTAKTASISAYLIK